MTKKYTLSQKGLDKLQLELDELKNVKRKQAVARLTLARGMGDLSENSEYAAAKEDLAFTEGRVSEIQEIINNVQIVEEVSDNSSVHIGDTVTVVTNTEQQIFKIVGELEADITQGMISDSSPIGKALLGKSKGSTVSINIPAGKIEYTILKIG